MADSCNVRVYAREFGITSAYDPAVEDFIEVDGDTLVWPLFGRSVYGMDLELMVLPNAAPR